MSFVAPDQVETHFTAAVSGLRPGGPRLRSGMIKAGSLLTAARCAELLNAQLTIRHIDLAARWLQSKGAGFYTIGSSGHEGNAGLAAALRLTDPALLHYRSGAFYLVRAGQASPPRDGVNDMLLGLVAGAAEPMAGGRHKVFGHPQLNVIPQTSTIASHLPRAVGLAFALPRAAKLGRPTPWPDDAIVVCSFGDASANHSTAAGAINTAAYCAYQGLPLPLLLVCEDNGLGISVRTPAGWIDAAQSGRPGVRYFRAVGPRPCVRPAAARGRGTAHAGPGHQPVTGRCPGGPAGGSGVRRGCRPQGRRLRGDQGPARAIRRGTGVRHGAGRAVHPRPGARLRAGGPAGGAGDPVPGLPAQRGRPGPRRGRYTLLLFPRAVPEPDGAADRGPRLPAGLRRSFSQ